MTAKTALVVEGGAMRGVFAAGVLAHFLQRRFQPFDVCLGVSSGAFALAAYLAGVPDAGLNVFTQWALEKEFLSFSRFARGGHLLDLDWLAAKVRAELQLSAAVPRFPAPLYVCLTQVSDGKPHYVQATADNLDELLRATTALPLLYRGFPHVAGTAYTDGGVSDAIPVRQAVHFGAKQILVIRSRPQNYQRSDTLGHRLLRFKLRKHSALVASMQQRVARHSETTAWLRRPPNDVQVIEICPPKDFRLGRFGKDRTLLLQGYQAGLAVAEQAIVRFRALECVGKGAGGCYGKPDERNPSTEGAVSYA